MVSVSKIGKYIKAARLFSLPCSLFPAAAGYLFVQEKSNSLAVLVCVLTAVALLHVASNLLNTYYDFKYKIDDADHCYDETLVKEILHEDEVLNAAWLCLAFAMLFFGSGVFITKSAHLIPYVLFFKAIFIGFNYSTGFKFKHNCLGEFVTYISFGPSIATFVYSSLSDGKFSWELIVASSPLGIAITSILYANNVRDSGHDLKCGVRTVANQLGLQNSLNLYSLLLLMPYVQVMGYVILYQHLELTLIWVLVPVTLYFAYYPHRSGVMDGVGGMFDRTLINFHLFASFYLGLLYYITG